MFARQKIETLLLAGVEQGSLFERSPSALSPSFQYKLLPSVPLRLPIVSPNGIFGSDTSAETRQRNLGKQWNEIPGQQWTT